MYSITIWLYVIVPIAFIILYNSIKFYYIALIKYSNLVHYAIIRISLDFSNFSLPITFWKHLYT